MTEHKAYVDLPLEDIIGDRFGRYSKILSRTGHYLMSETV